MTQRPVPPPPSDYQPQQPQYRPPPRRERKSRAGPAIALLIILLLLFYLLFYSPFGPLMLGPLFGQDSYPESSTFTLTRTIELNIQQGEVNYQCDLPVPEDYGIAQDIASVTTSPSASQITKFGDEWVQWTGSSDSLVQLSITVQAEVNTIIWGIDNSNSGHIADIPSGMDFQLGDEWALEDSGEYKIWPSNPTIRNLASSLTEPTSSVYDNVKSIYDYVRANVEYETVSGSEPKACLETLADGTGDCDDQSILLISLCRAADIPSWLVFGTLYDSVREQWGPHAWAEIYVPMLEGNDQAPVIDPANGDFFVRNCNRLEEWKSDGNGDHLDDYYHLLTYNYTVMGNQPEPVVYLDESYSGSYASSGIVTGCIELFLVPAKE